VIQKSRVFSLRGKKNHPVSRGGKESVSNCVEQGEKKKGKGGRLSKHKLLMRKRVSPEKGEGKQSNLLRKGKKENMMWCLAMESMRKTL